MLSIVFLYLILDLLLYDFYIYFIAFLCNFLSILYYFRDKTSYLFPIFVLLLDIEILMDVFFVLKILTGTFLFVGDLYMVVLSIFILPFSSNESF